MELRILGRTQVVTDGGEIALGGSQRRSLLAVLLVDAGVVVSADRLIEALWPVGPPMSAAQTVQSHVSHLRKLLGAGRIETVSGGYRLEADGAEVDAVVFEREFELGRVMAGSGDAAGAVSVLDAALGRWRGRAFEDADGCASAVAESARLEDLRTSALELLLDARLALGQHDRVAADAEAAVVRWPLRERLWASLMTALYRCGRHADALSAYQRLRTTLAEELGLEPSPSLVEIEARILRHDPSLLLAPPDANTAPAPSGGDGARAGGHEGGGQSTSGTTPDDASPMGSLPTGTVTFVFTDLEGSTRRWEADPEGMRGALARHDELLRDAVEAHGGHVVKTTGDGVLAAFARAPHAVLAAVEAQRRLAAEPWPTDEPLRVRMGLHTGEVDLVDGDYHGPPLNRAARLMSVAHGGQVLLSQITHRLSQEAPAEGIESVDLGEHQLRDLSRPERIYQLVGEGLSTQIGELRTLNAFPGNLPVQLTSFVGREQEIEQITAAFTERRLVTITGVGGVGKTRLSLQVAADLLPRFPDGAWVCELAAVDSPDALLQVVAATLGAPNRAGVSLTESLVDFLRAKRLLLVLDNCEHLLTSAGDIAGTLIASCPDIHVLATSREALAVDGEQVLPLRSLGLPPPASDQAVVAAAAAVRLFVERARAAGSDLTPEGDDLVAVADICRRLDGVPLALELAAARATAMSPADIAAHLDERFRLLTGGRRNAVERHQTLRAAVDWSYGSLAERDRVVFDRLGVFAGGFDLTAVEGVVAGDGVTTFDVVDALTSLVAKSMVVADRLSGGTTRYRLLETMRQYARDRLHEAGLIDQWRRCHATYFAGLAERAGPGLQGPDELAWRGRVGEDLDNLRAAVTWALDLDDQADVQLGLRIVAALVNEGVVRRASGIAAWSLRALERSANMSPGQQYDIRGGAAWDLFQSGDIPAAREMARQAVADGAPEGSTYTAGGYNALATCSAMLGDLDAARTAWASGREAAQRAPNEQFAMAALLSAEAMLLASAGDPTARACAERSLQMARQVRNPTVLVMANYAVGCALTDADVSTSRAAFEECIALSNAGAIDGTLGGALARVAPLRLRDGDPVGAIDALLSGFARLREIGDLASLATITDSSAGILHDLGALLAAALASLLLDRAGMPYNQHIEIEPGRRDLILARLRSDHPEVLEAAAHRSEQLSTDEVLDLLVEELTRQRTTLSTAREPALPVP